MSGDFVLTFERAGLRLGLAGERIADVAPDCPVQPVPGAPAGVAGVVLERGRLLTVIDVDRQLGIVTSGDEDTYLVRLRPPLAHVALRVAADIHLEPAASSAVEVLDLDGLVDDLERAIAHHRGG